MSNEYAGKKIPNVVFKTRVRDESVGGPNPYRWEDVKSKDLFKRKRTVLFSLPGAFTPTCSTYQLPGFEAMYDDFRNQGIDDIYCIKFSKLMDWSIRHYKFTRIFRISSDTKFNTNWTNGCRIYRIT